MKLLFLLSLYLLPFHEALNILFKGTLASAWKQMIVMIFLIWSFKHLQLNVRLSQVFSYLIFSLFLLLLSGALLGVEIEFVLLSGIIYYSFCSFIFSSKSNKGIIFFSVSEELESSTSEVNRFLK